MDGDAPGTPATTSAGARPGPDTSGLLSVPLRGVDVLVVGGGDSASEYVQYLVQEGCRVVLSYRGETFHRMNDINRDSLESLEARGKAAALRGSVVARVEDDGGRPRVFFPEPGPGPATIRALCEHLDCPLPPRRNAPPGER
jgi:hypothetical protein